MPDWFLGTLLGALLTYLATLLERRFNTKKQRERLLKALFEEVKLNHSVAGGFREQYGAGQWTVFDAAPLHSLAYQNIRASGELSVLASDTLSLLETTYELIHAHNSQVTAIVSESGALATITNGVTTVPLPVIRDRGLAQRVGEIEPNLKRLEEDFLAQLRYLR
jgi:hypothetical protein